ncbi:hypothetical protein [Massilibacteroides vaginae]|uniref:hypothetical protein n=1 Tax=Massilibacteroides vaginae TaxID=1673718 RepID=UPI001592B2FD|nr:hypothetical protein [Massilibacteroides vaginae]
MRCFDKLSMTMGEGTVPPFNPTALLCRPDRPSFVISTEVERSLYMASVKNSLMG